MKIKDVVLNLVDKHQTNNPFYIAAERNIRILHEPLGCIMGYFSRDFRISFIHINQDLTENEQLFVCSHELGHGTMHSHINTPFLRRHTLFSIDKIERQANTFAVELLLPDELLRRHNNSSIYSIAATRGIPPELVCLKRI